MKRLTVSYARGTTCVLVIGFTAAAPADFVAFSGELTATRPLFEAAAGGAVPLENFESFGNLEEVGSMPGVDAHFAPEDELGNPLPLPVILSNSPVTPPRWIGNAFGARPPWSAWVIRPDGDAAIYAFGQANSQGDWVLISAFDEDDVLVGSVEALPISHCFAGFVTTTPIARVVVKPLGNFDGLNGMDDVQVSVEIPPPLCPADVDHSGSIDFGDLLTVLSTWGSTGGSADLDGSGVVDFGDLLIVLSNWGPCP